jgi:NAD(P)-dependent dehydrogenase (short-subunit alcohol dehydrogenase family)
MSENWTTNDIPDLSGKVIIITGANSGIGYEAAKEFSRKGANTILACRSMNKAQTALDQIKQEIPNSRSEIMQLNLASLESVRQFASLFLSKYDRLDILVNNAGIMAVPYGTTEDGFERQLGTNHLGHFALTGLLFARLRNTQGSRVVNVSSFGHRIGRMDFDDLLYENGNGYSPAWAYGRSKLANLLFTYELQRRFEKFDVRSLAIAAHPGSSNSNLENHMLDQWMFRLMSRMQQSSAMGALPTLRAAVDPNARGSQYYGPGGFMEQRGYPVVVQSNAASHNEVDARRLWQVSEQLTGIHYNWTKK